MRGNDSPIGVKNRQNSIGEGARQATMQVYAPGEGRRETGSNKFLPERDTVERAWDPDTMIWNARSLQTVAKQLASGRVTPAEDVFLFTGQQLAEPILLALATEIALKAWHWTHPGKVEAPYTVCIASASNLTGLVKSSVECRRTGL